MDNHRVALWMIGEVNDLIRPEFVQFIGDKVQDATSAQFRLFDDLRARLMEALMAKLPKFRPISAQSVAKRWEGCGF